MKSPWNNTNTEFPIIVFRGTGANGTTSQRIPGFKKKKKRFQNNVKIRRIKRIYLLSPTIHISLPGATVPLETKIMVLGSGWV